MNLPKLDNLDIAGKRVLLRLDLDCEPDINDLRIKSSFETLDYLKSHNTSEIIILGHRGRPTTFDESVSLKPFQPIFDKWGARVEENLRFDPGEENNDPEFAKKLSSMGDMFVNEAFASSHREKEIENLSKVLENPNHPVLFLLNGIKKDKLDYLEGIKKLADRSRSDKILIGGRLPEYLGDAALESVRLQPESEQVIIGNLTMDKEDITLNTIDRFEKEIKKAQTIVVSGPVGKYEDEGHRQGTEKVFKAIIASSAYKVAGGGDTEKAINMLAISDKFDWISVGGGSMLEFLTKKTLPGLEALRS